MMGFEENHQYSNCISIANKHYHKLIKKLKKDLDVVEDINDSSLGYDNNLVEEEIGDLDDKERIVRRFRIIHTTVTSDEDGTEYDEGVEWVVMKKITIDCIA